MTSIVNDLVDDLVLLKYINSGCFSQTYISKKKGSDQLYATKKISLAIISQEPIFNKYLQNEIIILKQVNHPNIVKLYDVKIKPDYIYLVMEYCNGGSLLEALNYYKLKNGRPFTEKIVQFLMKQILSAVEYLHKNGIIHRDLKLDNILLNYKSQSDADSHNIFLSQIKIIDFNISSRLSNYTKKPGDEDEELFMNSNFFSNEFCDIIYDDKFDIWSLGALCYEMLTGQIPYQMQDHVQKISNINITIPKNISFLAQSFLSLMLEKNRKKRFSASQLLNHEFLTNNDNNINMNNINVIKENNIYLKFSRSAYTNRAKGILDIPKIDTFQTESKPISRYGGDVNFDESKVRNSIQPKNLFQTFFKDEYQPALKKYSVGEKMNNNHLNTIINCCKNNFLKFKDGTNTAKYSAEEIKQILGDNWLVLITDVNCGQFDFNVSPAQKGDFAVFSLDQKLFLICRY